LLTAVFFIRFDFEKITLYRVLRSSGNIFLSFAGGEIMPII
jgi:hypothetical protein